MAKKRKVKAKRAKKVKVVRVPKVPARAAREAVAPSQAEHVLGFAGGLIVVIAAIITLIAAFDIFTVISLVCGVLMIVFTWHTTRRARVSAILLLALSLAALILPPNGFIIGPILGLIGAIIVLARK